MTSLILVGTPKKRNIMVQALAVPRFRESWWELSEIEECLSRIAGGNVSRWVIDQARDHDIRLVHTRNYIPLKTAFHADWLLVREPELALALVEKFPQSDTTTVVESLKRERDALAETLEERARAGRYDLSRLPSDQRRTVADRFIEADAKVKDLSERIELLKIAEGLRSEWCEVIERNIEERDSERHRHPHCI